MKTYIIHLFKQLVLYLHPLSFALGVGITCLFINPNTLSAQDMSDCLRDYSLLKETHRTQWNHLMPGTRLYQSDAYLRDVKMGAFDQVPSNLVFFEYLRPATRQELRHNKVEGFLREAIGKDENVYVAKEAHAHFFQPNVAFEGYYHGQEGESKILLPLGLDPVDIQDLKDIPIILKERTSQYLLLQVNNDPLIFYLDYPSFDYVFDTELVRMKVDNKAELARAMIGREFLIQNQSELRFRSSPNGNDHIVNDPRQELTITVSNTITDRDKVLLITNSQQPNFLVLDQESDFMMWDDQCVQHKRGIQQQQLQAEAESVGTNERLNQLILEENTAEGWKLNPWLKEVITQRFTLEKSRGQKPRLYTYIMDQGINRQRDSFLSARVDEYGNLSLISQYASPNGLYHTRVIVYIGTDSLFSSRISALDEKNQRSYQQGWIVETLSLDKPEDIEIVEAILTSQGESIRVRFTSGGSFYQDIFLSEIDRQAIRDTWIMSQLIHHNHGMTLRESDKD